MTGVIAVPLRADTREGAGGFRHDGHPTTTIGNTMDSQDMNLESRMMEHMADIESAIAEKTFAIQHVFGSTTSDGFLYTIGLTKLNIPELRIGDFHYQLGGSILSTVASNVITEFGDFAELAPDASHVAKAMVGHEGYVIDMEECGSPRFRFSAPSVFDTDRPLGMAHRFFGRRVLYRDIVTTGWPCPRCVGRDMKQRCTCMFSCWWKGCDMLSDEQRALPPEKFV